MTKEEAIELIHDIQTDAVYSILPEEKEALDMAISALSENKGEWIKFKNFEEGYFHIKCSKCGQYWSIDDHAKIFKYCFNCGADMRGEI